MNFTEIVNEVVDITKRGDLASTRIPAAVSAATLKAHTSDYFYRDLIEIAIEFDAARNIQTFDPKQVLPTYRQFKYLRRWEGDVNTGEAREFFEHIQIQNAVDGYGYIKENVFYMAGSFIQIRALPEVFRCLFGAYQYPIIIEAQYQSWVADEFPYAIVNEAARQIFQQTRNRERAQDMRELVAEEYRNMRISYLDVVPG